MKKPTAGLLAIAYLLAALSFLMVGTGRLIRGWHYEGRNLRQHLELTLADLKQVGVLPLEEKGEGWFVSTDGDPQLIFTKDLYVESVQVKMQRQGNGHATLLYWKEPGQTNFSQGQSVYGEEVEPGVFRYDLQGMRVKEIRIDPDSAGGIITKLESVTVNPPRSWTWAFAPSWKGVMLFITLPLFFVALALEVKALFKNKH